MDARGADSIMISEWKQQVGEVGNARPCKKKRSRVSVCTNPKGVTSECSAKRERETVRGSEGDEGEKARDGRGRRESRS